MEHIFLVDPIGKLPEKPVCLKRLSSLTGWDFSTGLFRSIHILLGFPSSSRPFTIYFRCFPILWEMESACSERDFPIEIFAFHLQFETRWVFDVNGKQPMFRMSMLTGCNLPLDFPMITSQRIYIQRVILAKKA